MFIMRFLITNDDGIDSPGLAVLADAAAELGAISVIAPARNWSVCGHRVTTQEPLVARQVGERWAVEGTPADCVRLGHTHLADDFEWTLAGVNHGGNLGADVYLSGTVAAVREGLLLGRPGIAISHYRKREIPFDWPRASRWVRMVLRQLLETGLEPATFWNVNLPSLAPEEPEPALRFCPIDVNPLPVAFRIEGAGYVYEGNYHTRPRAAGSDIDVCFGGSISVSRLRL
jgi:5'-nucleotidase